MHDPATLDPDATTERLAFAEATDPPSPPIDSPPLAETLAATPEPLGTEVDLEQLESSPNVTVERIKYRRFVATARSR